MRIAVVGSGISGLVTARLLADRHEIVLFEADRRIGGHINTVHFTYDGEEYSVDTGFIVYNDRTYPNFSEVLAKLNVETDPTSMSFSVRCDRTGLEYNGSSLRGVFAQRRNLLRPSFLRMIRDILRFNREGQVDLNRVPESQTVGQYLSQRGYSKQFAGQYLLPMGAAIWSCPFADFEKFPIRFILEFYGNHGLLSLTNRPQWRVIRGGSQRYVDRLVAPFRHNIRTNCGVRSVTRCDVGVRVEFDGGEETFDEIVFACHSVDALRLLVDADELEKELLAAFPYSVNTATLHTDISLLPKRRSAWASWNYHIGRAAASRPTLTYNMNILQHIRSRHVFCVTLNEENTIAEEKIIARFRYAHPVFTTTRATVQRRHCELIRRRNTSFCGAYWRNGFHEDGVVSALAVCRKYGIHDLSSMGQPAAADCSLRRARHTEPQNV
ncbi:MAG: FAD-dependent oxidoreductase [Planctomycetales bacterium]|nr:FAD-dependent oxidoreductase [Planctomycetales bacterium]